MYTMVWLKGGSLSSYETYIYLRHFLTLKLSILKKVKNCVSTILVLLLLYFKEDIVFEL